MEADLTIENMTQNGASPDETPSVRSESTQLSLLAGGAEPTTGTVKLKGITRRTTGDFEKGERVQLEVRGRVVEVDFVDRVDKWGVLHVERRHVIEVEDIDRQ